jgi:4-hydroxy-tetrahydrodipicolinate synthase
MYGDFKGALKGINAINITPFDQSKNIEWDLLRKNIDFLLENDIKAIYPGGNTGEFYSLTIDEVKKITKFVVEHVNGRAKVIAGIGYDYKTATEFARYAENIGADGVMIHQPLNPFMLENGLVEYYREISSSTTLPVVLYVRQKSINLNVLKEVLKIPNIIGVKYAINDLMSFAEIVQEINEDVVWICGSAEMWAPFFFMAGADGFTSGLVNVDTKRSAQMLRALKDKQYQEAMRIWNDVRPFEELRAKHDNGNNVSVVKEAMKQIGLSNGIVRAPIASLTEEEIYELRNTLMNWGLITEILT